MIMGMGIMSIIYILKQMRKSIKDLSNSLNKHENIQDIEDGLSEQFNNLLMENEEDENFIDGSRSYMGVLFESQSELERLIEFMNDEFEKNPIGNLKKLENIIEGLNKFRKAFEESSLRLEEIQKENIENHMNFLLDKINKLKKDYVDEDRAIILYRIEKKIVMRDIER